ncbi:hypothetical protein BLOT_009356, partial [Blomia tropicalis]
MWWVDHVHKLTVNRICSTLGVVLLNIRCKDVWTIPHEHSGESESLRSKSPFNLLENVKSCEVGSPEYLKIICSINSVLNGFAHEIFQEL